MMNLSSIIRHFDGASKFSCNKLNNPEVEEIINEGVEHFKKASEGVAPFQMLIVGIRYCVYAIEEWKKTGALGDKKQDLTPETK